MDVLDIDPINWFSNREINSNPKHFVIAQAVLSEEARMWVMDKLKGRFTILPVTATGGDGWDNMYTMRSLVSFEDPSEAVLYELTWS